MTARDDGENVRLFELLMISNNSRARAKLNDLALTLAEKSAAFSASLPPAIASSLGDAVRIANCYYSNLIEGHNIAPTDIEWAMREDYGNGKTRAAQSGAWAHIAVQKWIDEDGMVGTPYSTALIAEVHRRLYEHCSANRPHVEGDNRDKSKQRASGPTT
jgi:Fic family protein